MESKNARLPIIPNTNIETIVTTVIDSPHRCFYYYNLKSNYFSRELASPWSCHTEFTKFLDSRPTSAKTQEKKREQLWSPWCRIFSPFKNSPHQWKCCGCYYRIANRFFRGLVTQSIQLEYLKELRRRLFAYTLALKTKSVHPGRYGRWIFHLFLQKQSEFAGGLLYFCRSLNGRHCAARLLCIHAQLIMGSLEPDIRFLFFRQRDPIMRGDEYGSALNLPGGRQKLYRVDHWPSENVFAKISSN